MCSSLSSCLPFKPALISRFSSRSSWVFGRELGRKMSSLLEGKTIPGLVRDSLSIDPADSISLLVSDLVLPSSSILSVDMRNESYLVYDELSRLKLNCLLLNMSPRMFMLNGEPPQPAGPSKFCITVVSTSIAFCFARSSFSIRLIVLSSILASASSNDVGNGSGFSRFFLPLSTAGDPSILSSPNGVFSPSSVFSSTFKGGGGMKFPFSMGKPIFCNDLRALAAGVNDNPTSWALKSLLPSPPLDDCLRRSASRERRASEDFRTSW